tara:strand:+ start:307 stop:747 length:441 start_codon:yes stop_codon:yes gene_type:complete
MNNDEKQQLQKMIDANSVEDNSEIIRNMNHSEKIYDDIQLLLILKKRYASMPETVDKHAIFEKECSFLFTNYKNLYEKIYQDQLDLNIMKRMLEVLAKIENNELDQHGASFEIGKFLKEVYIDTAIYDEKREVRNISWADYKRMKQ